MVGGFSNRPFTGPLNSQDFRYSLAILATFAKELLQKNGAGGIGQPFKI